MFSSTNLPRSTCSPTVPSLYRGRAVFFRREKTSLRTDPSFPSLCLVTTQKPPSSKPPMPIGCSFHQIGAVRRISASSSIGSRWAEISGSGKSNPGGRFGVGIDTSSLERVLVALKELLHHKPGSRHGVTQRWQDLSAQRRRGCLVSGQECLDTELGRRQVERRPERGDGAQECQEPPRRGAKLQGDGDGAQIAGLLATARVGLDLGQQ